MHRFVVVAGLVLVASAAHAQQLLGYDGLGFVDVNHWPPPIRYPQQQPPAGPWYGQDYGDVSVWNRPGRAPVTCLHLGKEITYCN